MKILIEKYEYESKLIQETLPGLHFQEHGKEHKCSFDNVGYYFNSEINDCLFFLPKVLLSDDGLEDDENGFDGLAEERVIQKKENGNLLLGKYNPEHIIDIDHPTHDVKVNDADRDFIHNFAIWIYRTMAVYREKNVKENSIKNKNIAQLDNSGTVISGSNLDNVLALVKFHNENRDFLLFTMQNIKRGYNKINWNKTIAHRVAIQQSNGSVLYMNPVNKKKQVNYEEELIVIFYSILNYISKVMGFTVKFNMNFELIPAEIFENVYLNGLGRNRLLQIKYKYFSDKSLNLWNLCYRFFDRSTEVYSSQQYEEYLMSTSFESIFENIIDDLIGSQDVMGDLKNQRDGKIVDHIYSYNSLINGNQSIYYIGDSKYYKIGHEVVGSALYKQYTYAKNVIQYNLNLFLAEKQGKPLSAKVKKRMLPYRDEMTEGYNITPNFFISAKINKLNSMEYDYNNPHLEEHKSSEGDTALSHVQKQFENRLFDRDTLWLSQYDINFLFIIALYVRDNDYAKDHFRRDARELFRRRIIPIIEAEYDFFILVKKEEDPLKKLVDKHFRILNGKIYHPFNKAEDDDKTLILALEKKETTKEENSNILEVIQTDFYIFDDFHLEDNITEFLDKGNTRLQNEPLTTL